MLKFEDFVGWGFQGLIAGVVTYGVAQLGGLRKSIEALNERVATVIEKTGWHERELERHENRLDRLEHEHRDA